MDMDNSWRLLLIVVLFSVIFIPSVVAANDSPEKEATTTFEISDSVAAATGEQTVVVRLTDHSSAAIRTTDTTNRSEIMKTHAAATQKPFLKFAEGNPHVEIDDRLWLTNAITITLDTDAVPPEQLGKIDNVEQIHENYQIATTTATTANASLRSSAIATENQMTVSAVNDTSSMSGMTATRAIKKINVPDVWDTYDTRGDGINVAVVDTGVNPSHPDINIDDNNWVCYIDCSTNPDGPHDVDGHGTHVSGTIVGGSSNDAGLHIGVAPEATLMHAKGINDDGQGTFTTLTKSMQWAIDNDADVLSMSLGTPGINDELIDPVRNAQDSGVVVIGAVGNNEAGTSTGPANVYDTTAVGSVDVEPSFPEGVDFSGIEDNTISDFSGGEVIESDEWSDPPNEWPASYTVPDITAPGAVIWSADTKLDTQTCGNIPTQELTCQQGSSMATPHVAGTVALMLSAAESQLSPTEIRFALRSTAVDLGAADTRQGSGRINATAAVAAVVDNTNTAPTAVFNYSPSSPVVGEEVTLNASGSVDSDGEIASYEWDIDSDGTTDTTGKITTYSYYAAGEYDIKLIVTDNDGKSVNTTKTITVSDNTNTAPTAVFNYSPSSPVVGEEVTFNASGSVDPDGQITSYEWMFDETGSVKSGKQIAHTYNTAGEYTVKLLVTDDGGATTNTTQTIIVTKPSDIPDELDSTTVNAIVAEAGVADYSELTTLNVLDAYASYLADGTVGGQSLSSSLPILDTYAYALENPSEFN
ncbi:S8 family serine peptidase [Halonotius sp. F2-221B]|uniref:S8 family serine peptidase n=1 Tax=Halonotius sp. F2-221B TaxID=2731620 RepID=UPI00398B96A7